MANVLVIHGPNLNLLGKREKKIYGGLTLPEIDQHLKGKAQILKHELSCIQSNAEHELVNTVQKASEQGYEIIIINPGAFTHTSLALRDAFLAVSVPFIEVHISNIQAREEYRRHSFLSDIAKGVIFGFGPFGYELALNAVNECLVKRG